ncbi:hypothetical protein SPFL3102_02324 [Sporomusaceae bacterium FL31]|nr:hypothetical protein SPFL3101_02260 [Sporomusaceae bacterium FL31]GCE34511.1 hypothetical protein SPFL3102_02324 [Sporomusaceae bacterium]
MNKSVLVFEDIEPAKLTLAGGKGGMLAKLFQRGYSVPTALSYSQRPFRKKHSLSRLANEFAVICWH